MSAGGPAEALYRVLLRAYPRRFRQRYGTPMAQLFRDRYRRAAAGGSRSTAAFFAGTLLDVAHNAALERLTVVKDRIAVTRERLLYPRHDHSFYGDKRGSMFFQSTLSDLKQAWRVLARAPKGTMALAVATLALGVGANAAMFTVIFNVLISPLPYPGADRVQIAWRYNQKFGDVSLSPQRADVDQWRKASSVEAVASYLGGPMVAGGDAPAAIDAVQVDEGVLDFTGTRPILGRPFTAADRASHVAILSEGIWKKRFGASPAAIGQTIELDDKPYEIVGVVPSTFRLPMTDVDILVPLAPLPAPVKGQRPPQTSVSALLRLRPGISREAATTELDGLSLDKAGTLRGWRVRLMPPGDLSGPTFRRTLFILLGAVGCVLLIACANVAHLVLARNAARRREIAVRVALGASRGRLACQLFAESLILALVGGAAGLALGLWGVQAISASRPADMRQLAGLRMSPEIFGIAFLLALLTAVVFGLLPAIAAARGATSGNLKQGGPAMHGRRGAFARRAITVAEVALALILLAGAGLLLRSYARVLTADRGFQADGLLAVKIELPRHRYASQEAQVDFHKRAGAAVAGIDGVSRVVMASGAPPDGGLIFGELEIEGREKSGGAAVFGGGFVQPGFFESLRIPLRAGRTLAPQDVEGQGNGVVLINELTATRYFQTAESAIGKRLRLGAASGWDTIIGVVGDVDLQHGEVGGVQLYFPLARPGVMGGGTTMLIATRGNPSDLIVPVKTQLRNLDPKLPLEEVQTVEQAIARVTARPRFNVVMLTAFAGIGLLLAVIGIYGVVSYSVGLRTKEIGLRMALGAVPSVIARAVIRETLALAAIGTAIGLAGALAGARVMTKLLFGVSPNDPLTLAIVALVLAATAVVAALVPARRAMRVDPMVALRTE